ncbi:MAG: hypothetical protein OEV49_05420 [candidate division Zixibacteria bacterium]|nr:hypothetical protein [candidate division Zixibacteria bacterium]MDH3936716.1 hypothetical protein [candidate division Zixibacteria bacterium]MDH4032569.1 hypothetical protein [candidate division Zixibacteria bacterium]
MNKALAGLVLILGSVLLLTGCLKNYMVTVPMEESLNPPAAMSMGNFVDQLPPDMKPEDKPTAEEIAKFKEYIITELEKKQFNTITSDETVGVQYELRAGVLDFSRGSGLMRFLFGLLGGAARLKVHLYLVDLTSDSIVFAGHFTYQVTDWMESGDQIYKRIAKDFARELKSQTKKVGG